MISSKEEPFYDFYIAPKKFPGVAKLSAKTLDFPDKFR